MILNGLPWKQTEIILPFLRLHSRTAFWALLLTTRAAPFLLRDSYRYRSIVYLADIRDFYRYRSIVYLADILYLQ